ncbi:hypothetical protein WDZ92_04420 [Nostoc sp. NIES-2111]
MTASMPFRNAAGVPGECAAPTDAQHFDHSTVQVLPPGIGEIEIVLARFELPLGYCGVLEAFSQFTNAFGVSAANIMTPGLSWQLLINRQPVAPYLSWEHIINPWGYCGAPIAIKLPASSRVEFTVRRRPVAAAPPIQSVGGRIQGRYWYSNR